MSRQQELKQKEIDSTMQVADQVKGNIQVDQYAGADFSIGTEFEVDLLPFDTLLLQYEDGDLDMVQKGGIFLPTEVATAKVWRTAKVVLAGETCRWIKEGDFVVFPNDKGIVTKSINVAGKGALKNCIFLAEDRVFAKARKIER